MFHGINSLKMEKEYMHHMDLIFLFMMLEIIIVNFLFDQCFKDKEFGMKKYKILSCKMLVLS